MIPDAGTRWLFRHRVAQAGLLDARLFDQVQ